MKYKIIILSVLLFMITPVMAKDNRLYIIESNNQIYYESKEFNEKIFMRHLDMVPGKSYTDELVIENGTHKKYTIYFKSEPVEQSSLADSLLENILMDITLDGVEIYNGRATGLDYTGQGVNLENAILIGEFTPTKKAKMVVHVKLADQYSDVSNHELSNVRWVFYAQYDDSDPSEIIINPDTMKNSFPYTIVFSAILILIGLEAIRYDKKKNKKKKKS